MDIAGETTPGSRASRKRACVLWRGDGTTQPFRSWFSFACENRAPWSGADGWVEKCAWALTCGTPTQDCLRWANDKYKGTRAFRATLWHREASGDDKSTEASGVPGSWPRQRRSPRFLPKTCTRTGNACVTILGRRSLKLHATEISLSRSKRKEKNQCCTTLAAIHAGYVTKIRMRILKKIQGGKKKSRVCISSG